MRTRIAKFEKINYNYKVCGDRRTIRNVKNIFEVETHPEYQNRGYASILINKMIKEAEKENRKGIVLTCKKELIHYYEKFGFVNEGISGSVHGNVV